MTTGTIDIDEVKVDSVMSKDFITIDKNTQIRELRRLFLQSDFATLPITDEEGRLVGVVAAFDFLKLFDVDGKFDYERYKEKTVSQLEAVARKGAITVGSDDSLRKCIEYMSSFRMRYLPVLDKKRKVVGLISITDIVRYMLPE